MELDQPTVQQQSLSPTQQLINYQDNVKKFIQHVQEQISTLIDNYEQQLQQLLKQNKILKQQINKGVIGQQNSFAKEIQFSCISPIKKNAFRTQKFITNAKSNPFQNNQFPKLQPIYQTNQKKLPFFKDQVQLKPSRKSRFQIQSKKNKQYQQQLLESLEAGKNNLNKNTNRFKSLMGRNEENQEQIQVQIPVQEQTKIYNNNSLNTSLNLMFQSLDSSVYAKKARVKSQAKKKKNQNFNNQYKRKQEAQKLKKDQALKNLLKSLRNNVSSTKPPQIIKVSRLMTTGSQLKNNSKVMSSKSKVMINPVPVDITQRLQNNSHIIGEDSLGKRSILKQSAILTKSIANISSVSFHTDS